MNKFAIIALLAFVGCVSCAPDLELEDDFSQLPVMKESDGEVKYLAGDNVLFSDFCVNSRDEIKNFMKQSANSAAASVFMVFFSTASEIGDEVLKAGDESIKQGAEAIKDFKPEGKVDDHTVEQLGLFRRVSEGASFIVNAVLDTARRELFTRIQALRENFNPERIKFMITSTCSSISYQLWTKLEMDLNQAKNELRRETKDAAQREFISKATINNIGCLTAGRVAKVNTFCKILDMAGNTIYPLFGL